MFSFFIHYFKIDFATDLYSVRPVSPKHGRRSAEELDKDKSILASTHVAKHIIAI